MIPPPIYHRPVVKPPMSYPRDLNLCFAANSFDPRFIEKGAERHLTPLGLLINSLYWYETNKLKCGLAFRPIANSIRDMIGRLAPDALVDLERHINEQQ